MGWYSSGTAQMAGGFQVFMGAAFRECRTAILRARAAAFDERFAPV
jgi:hypothetical protein